MLRKFTVSLAAGFLAFIPTSIVVGHYYSEWAVREYPHDGQIGLGAIYFGVMGGCAAAFIAFTAVFLWSLRRKPS
jgi:hypothetical protein